MQQIPGLEQERQVSDERIAGVVMRVLEKVNEESKERSHLEGIKNELGSLKKLLCDDQGRCRLVTVQQWESEMAKREEKEKTEKGTYRVKALPDMKSGFRKMLKPSDEEWRDDEVSRIAALLNVSDVDMERHIKKDGQNNLKLYGLQKAGRADFENCYVGQDGKVHCDRLREEGLRVQVQDAKTKKWRELGLSEEQQKAEERKNHF